METQTCRGRWSRAAIALLLVSCGSCRESTTAATARRVAPTSPAEGATIELSGRNEGIAFAKNGAVWGAAWLHKTGRQTQMHLGDTCFEEVYFASFNDQLELALPQPVRALKKRKCVFPTKVEIVATPKGFAVAPSDSGAEFDLASKGFASGSSFPAPAPVAPEVARLQSPWPKTHVLRTGNTFTLFAVQESQISMQRFGAGGEPLGKPEVVLAETNTPADETKYPQDGNSIYNVTVSSLADECVILYTRGNTGMKLYSCKTRKKRYLGEATMPSLHCADGRCVMSEAGQRIRFLAL
jgi:hypothetical protein